MLTPLVGTSPLETSVGTERPNAFGRLVALMKENERLLLDLQKMNERCRAAKAYLSSPECRLPLALAYLTRVRSKRSELLTVLRANRLAGEELLASLECGASLN